MAVELVMLSNHLILCRPLLLLPSIFPSIRVPMSQLFASGGQSIGASVSASVLPVHIQGWLPLGWTGLISLRSGLHKGQSRKPTLKAVKWLKQRHTFSWNLVLGERKVLPLSSLSRWPPKTLCCFQSLSHVWLFVTPGTTACPVLNILHGAKYLAKWLLILSMFKWVMPFMALIIFLIDGLSSLAFSRWRNKGCRKPATCSALEGESEVRKECTRCPPMRLA